MHRFAITSISAGLREAVAKVAESIRLGGRVGSSVFLKPNFTYPFFKPGVTTTRELIQAVVELLKDYGCRRICLGEGDGGYNSFSMEETFANFRLDELEKEYGLEVVNVCRWPSLPLEIQAKRGVFTVNLPRPLFEEFDSYISLAVPKVHAMTTISNAVKNQWGLVQDTMRLHFHCAFDEIITEITRRLPSPSAIVDGKYGLTRNGPMIEGVDLELNWVSACDNLWLNDQIVCELMRIPMERVEHLMFAAKQGLMPARENCRMSGELAEFIDDRFYLKRNIWNRAAKLTWYSRRLNYLVYFSPISSFLHKVMYSIRTKPEELKVKGVDWS
jgi:uncharacterized protein (DUF362 family)